MKFLALLATTFACLNAAPTASGQYLGHQVLRVKITDAAQLAKLESFVESVQGVSIWNDLIVGDVDLIASPSVLGLVKDQLAMFNYSVLIPDVQALIDQERAHSSTFSVKQTESLLTGGPVDPKTLFKDYQDADVYVAYLAGLPGAEKITIGQSYLKKDINGVKFGNGPRNIVFHGGIHAREWISPATATYVASFLLGDSAEAVDLRSKFTFHAIPVLNVDGYAYTRDPNGDRLWRKNRQPAPGSSCLGTDPNRNFPTAWSKPGASGSPCSETYYGPSALSAPESAAIYNYVKNLGNVISYMDFHAYSQLWMFPYGYDCNAKAKDFDTLSAGSKKAVSALKAVNNISYKDGPICNTIYQASGSSVDAMYDLGVKYSYTAELRDTGRNGFVLPASQSIPSGEETTKAMVALYNHIAQNL